MMSRRAMIRWISYGAALVLCLFGVLASSFAGAHAYENRIDADTSRALGSTMDAVQSLDMSLKKSAYAVTPVMENRLCMEIYGGARQVEIALASLPVQSYSLEKIAKHIAVVGDYASMLSRQVASGERFDEDSIQQLSKFSDLTAQLHDALAALQEKIASGEVTNESFKRITDTFDNLESELSENVRTLADEMQSVSDTFPEPSVPVYDGAYGAAETSPKLLQGKSEIPLKRALEIAAVWLGSEEHEVTEESDSSGEIPCYHFSARHDGSSRFIAVSKIGGEVVSMTSDAMTSESKISVEQAEKKADQFLKDHGFSDMERVEATISGGEAAFRYAPVLENNILCLPDSVVVTVSLGDGTVCDYQASDYIRHHHERDLSVFNTTTPETDSALPSGTTVQSIRPVILLSAGEKELFCYSVDCTTESDESFRVVINAETGEQERILLADELEAMG